MPTAGRKQNEITYAVVSLPELITTDHITLLQTICMARLDLDSPIYIRKNTGLPWPRHGKRVEVIGRTNGRVFTTRGKP